MPPSSLIDALIEALRCLPGVGRKSARRMAYHLVERDRDGARRLAAALVEAMDRIGHCRQCRMLTEKEICDFCSRGKRDTSLLCVVETPADAYAIDETGYQGQFFVLMGHLSPLDGIGPEHLGLDHLGALLDKGEIREVILATNLTVEGEATAHFIGEMVRKRGIRATRIAHGVPVGGELEYVDSSTLAHAIAGRREV
jgi:recombination protein RecR